MLLQNNNNLVWNQMAWAWVLSLPFTAVRLLADNKVTESHSPQLKMVTMIIVALFTKMDAVIYKSDSPSKTKAIIFPSVGNVVC